MAERMKSSAELGETEILKSLSVPRPVAEQVRSASTYVSREPEQQSSMRSQPDQVHRANSQQTVNVREPRRIYRTGRNATISIRATAATIERFYQLADRLDSKAAEAFEQAIAAMMEKLDRDGR